jgi:predicted membrane protein
MKTTDKQTKKISNSAFGFALLLIVIGAVLLLSKLQIIPAAYNDVLFKWPMLLLILGFIAFVKKHITTGFVLWIVGGFFIIPILGSVPDSFIGTVPANFTATYWPILLIIAGVLFLFNRLFSTGCCSSKYKASFHSEFKDFPHTKTTSTDNNDYMDKNCTFASIEHIVLEPEFKGGKINNAFGETVIDLRKTNLKEGDTFLDVQCMFGAVVIYVPEHWQVKIKTNASFGAFEDNRHSKGTDASKSLVIIGSVMFGAGELRN